MKGNHAYWIHKKVNKGDSVNGVFYLPECTCSNCGYQSGMEKDKCPSCKAVMDAKEPKE